MTRGVDFDELMEGADPDDRERLRRVHDMLVTAGPPAELPPEIEAGPTLAMTLGRQRSARRVKRRVALLAAAVIILLVAFLAGYITGNDQTVSGRLIKLLVRAVGARADEHEAGEAQLVEHRKGHRAGQRAVRFGEVHGRSFGGEQGEGAVLLGIALLRRQRAPLAHEARAVLTQVQRRGSALGEPLGLGDELAAQRRRLAEMPGAGDEALEVRLRPLPPGEEHALDMPLEPVAHAMEREE